jgi:hypothetical protein
MHYFAYAPEHDLRPLLRWANNNSAPPIDWALIGPAVLREHDIGFPVYHPAVGGGRAALREGRGRRVAGVVYELPDAIAPVLDAFIESVYDDAYGERPQKLAAVANRLGDAERFDVVAYSHESDQGRHVPPTPEYIRSLATFASRLGHSHSWLMHLLSFSTTTGEAAPIMYDI